MSRVVNAVRGRNILQGITIQSLALLLCGFGQPKAATFQFAPDPDHEFVQFGRSTVVEAVEGEGGEKTTVQEARYRVRVTRDGNGSYRLEMTPSSYSVTVNGRGVENPIVDVMRKAKLGMDIGEDGTPGRVYGVGELIEELRKQVPEAAWAMVSALINEDAFVRLVKAEWEGRVSSLAGRTLSIGETFKYRGAIESTWGSMVGVVSEATLSDWTPCGDAGARKCVRLTYRYSVDPDTARQALGKALSLLAPNSPEDLRDAVIQELLVEGHGERIVEPATLTTYEETESRTIRLRVRDGSGVEKAATRSDKREYRNELAAEQP